MIELNKQYDVRIIDLDYKGDGIAKINDTFIYVNGLLTDERAIIKITKSNEKFAIGEIVKITKESEDRIKPNSNLGSLNLYHLDFSKQLKWQSKITKETLEKVLRQELNILNIITDNNAYNYRNKVVFHVLKEQVLKLGLFSNDNQNLEVVNNFILATQTVNDIIKAINEAKIEISINTLNSFIFKNNSNNNVLVTIASKSKSFKGLEEIVRLLKTFKRVVGLTINIKKYKEKILSEESYLIYGINLLSEKGLLINDQSFIQVNYGVMNLAYQVIKENLLGKKIIDAYSGVGSIGYTIYDEKYHITMIENNEANIKLAEMIKANFNYQNIKIVKANAEDVIKDLNADTIIVDPPRKGLARFLINEVVKNDINRVIYLSCDLQTLARDLKIFSDYYKIDKIYPVKMFPQTNSFETLVIMTRR